MRAVSVPVDEASSNAGLIFPGDRVDLIVTQNLDLSAEAGAATRRVSETVLRDLRVIAMGRSLKGEAEGELVAGAQARTATLETTPAGAEKIALASELGKLSLSLRSLAVGDGTQPPGTAAPTHTWDLEVSPALRPENQPHATMALVRGGKAETVTVRRGAGS
jgi:pilus assembly protein CpaB